MIFKVYRDEAHEFRWRLVAANGETMADSGEGYANRSNAKRAIRRLKGEVYRATIVDL